MNTEQLKRDIEAKKIAATALLTATAKACEAEGNRLQTADEKAAIDKIMGEGRELRARYDAAVNDELMIAQVGNLTAGFGPKDVGPRDTPAAPRSPLTLGQQWTRSEGFEFFKKGGHKRASAWSSPTVELMGATLTTDAASGGSLVVPDHRPGILPILFRRLVVADLMAPGTTDSNVISYMRETTFTNAADTVLEGGTKPESTLIFDAVSDPVRKIAHWLPVTEEMLEDVAQIESYIDARLRTGIDLTEEDQLLNGLLNTAPDITGLLNRPGLATAQARGTDTNMDAVFKQMTAIASATFVAAEGIVMNPVNWQAIQLAKNSQGNYLGSGPWAPAQPAQLWGLPVAVTPAMAAGSALVGAFRTAAQIFRKGGVRVEASNSHADFFIKNLVAIRAEERLALAVYRPGAFGLVTGLN